MMESKSNPSTPKPSRARLERRNAAKNIDYEVGSGSTSFDAYPWGDGSSFRMNGKEESQLEFLCKSLGLSGPDDFGILPNDYTLMKARSAQLSSSSSYNLQRKSSIDQTLDVDLYSRVVEDDVIVSDKGVELVVLSGGIKGERPPAVFLAPPPSSSMLLLPPSSSWDIFRSFGPTNHRIIQDDDQGGSDDEDEDLSHHYDSFTDDSSPSSEPMSQAASPNPRISRQISSWAKGKHLGSGSYGSVYEGIADGGFFFAVKEVSLLDQGDKGKEIIYHFEQEMAFLSNFEHKNIVRYLGTDKDDSNLYIFLELVPQGSLLSLYQRFHFQDSHVSVYTRQILEGLKYLHERNVVHRDIKCANILLDVNGYVKLADFGLAKVAKLNDAKSTKGTSYWMAPEVVKPNQGYGRAADIWSLGCTVLEMLTRNFPYHPLDGYQAMFRIGSGVPPAVAEFISRDARDFILKCLQVDPDIRPSAADLLEHSFVNRPHSSSSHHLGKQA